MLGRDRARVRGGGAERPAGLELDPGAAAHTRPALELLRAARLPDDAGAPEGPVLRPRDHRRVGRRQHHRGGALRGHAGAPARHPRGRRHQPDRGRGRARDEHRRRGQAAARAEGHAGQGHDRAPGLRRAARVHRDPRRDPAALRAVLLHGQQGGRLHPAHRLQRDDGLPPGRGRRLRARAREGAARAAARGRQVLHPRHPRQPGGAPRPGVRGVEPVHEEGPAGGVHPRPHRAGTSRTTSPRPTAPGPRCRSWCSPRATARARARSWRARSRTTTAR